MLKNNKYNFFILLTNFSLGNLIINRIRMFYFANLVINYIEVPQLSISVTYILGC